MHINKLKGKDSDKPSIIEIYNDKRQPIPPEEKPERLLQVWKSIYQSNENRIADAWNPEQINDYKQHLESIDNNKLTTESFTKTPILETLQDHYDMVQTKQEYPYQLEEHCDMAMTTLDKFIQPMKPQKLQKMRLSGN